MTNTRTQPAGSERTPNIGVEPRDNVELTELANLDAFHLRQGRNQDVGAFLVGQRNGCFEFQQWHAGGLHPGRAALNQ